MDIQDPMVTDETQRWEFSKDMLLLELIGTNSILWDTIGCMDSALLVLTGIAASPEGILELGSGCLALLPKGALDLEKGAFMSLHCEKGALMSRVAAPP